MSTLFCIMCGAEIIWELTLQPAERKLYIKYLNAQYYCILLEALLEELCSLNANNCKFRDVA